MENVGCKKYILVFLAMCLAALAFFVPGAAQAEGVPTLVIEADGKRYVYRDEPIAPSDFSVVEQIEERRINASLDQKAELVELALSRGADYKTAMNVCFPLFTRLVDGIARDMYVPAENAEVRYKNGRFFVTQQKPGRRLDENKLYASAYCALRFSGGGSIKASAQKVEPTVRAEELSANLVKRSEYTTDYAFSKPARAHNINLALSKIDGAVIPAGATLSFNATVGERTEDNGFLSARIIVDGKYTEGVGGGVCQASTAVYNAALIAGLDCSANAHSILPAYCPAGLDAMISSVSDLTVTNTTAHPVYISARTHGGRARVCVFGEPNEYTVVPESVVTARTPFERTEVEDGTGAYFDGRARRGDRLLVSAGKDGVKSETYLNYYKKGELVRRERIRVNEYRAIPEITAVCTRK